MKVIVIFGTRPEAIKMAPVVKELQKRKELETFVCVTAQHREMLDKVLEIFDIVPDYDLNIFKPGQTLTDITIESLKGLEEILTTVKPDLLLVQGDTSTVFSGALASFYHKIKIGHVEAGLRSNNLYSPYPEEANRRLVSVLADYNFCPTDSNRQNLLNEGISDSKIYITGNTVIDSLKYTVKDDYEFEDEVLKKLDFNSKRFILLTSHRRENIGQPMKNIFNAVKDVLNIYEDVEVIFPMHLNPKVRKIAVEILGNHNRVHLISPLDYFEFTNLLNRVHFVITDSGGIQEEAPTMGKPVIVVREETERMEGVDAGSAILAGTEYKNVYNALDSLLKDDKLYNKMSEVQNPYGDGFSAQRIVDIILKYL
ncbi:MAG: UDP-N-acetylglucosamine 2-epimerase (non-hydrolyzing) [Tissierellia bacterium]|nr:UDP-N-acetylglucosamine 2-epimerase (non-hydrolyzing) [Tissierellia bacterium]